MSKIIRSVGVALAATAVLGLGVGTATASTVHQETAARPAQASQIVYTKGFQVQAGLLPDGTFLKVTDIVSNNVGALDSGPAIGSTLQSVAIHDYEVTWFAAKDDDVKVTYHLFRSVGDQSYDTGGSAEVDFNVDMWDNPSLTVVSQTGLVPYVKSGDPYPVVLAVA